MGTDRFIDAANGNSANSGTSASPWRDHNDAAAAAFIAAMGDGDRLIGSGKSRPTSTATLNTYAMLAISGRTGAAVLQWDGMPQWEFRGDAIVTGPWVLAAGTRYTKAIEAGLTVNGATSGYDHNLFTLTGGVDRGRYGVLLQGKQAITLITAASPGVVTSNGHGLANGDRVHIHGSNCTPTIDGWRTVANVTANTFTVGVNTSGGGNAGFVGCPAGCTATTSSMFYSAVGTLHINIGGDPTAEDITIVRGDLGALITVAACTGLAIRGIECRNHSYMTTGGGYGIVFEPLHVDCVVEDCQIQDVANHGITCHRGTNLIYRRCVIGACGSDASQFAFTGTGGTLTRALAEGCRAHVIGHRKLDGTDGNTFVTVSGFFFGHDLISDIEHRDCTAYVYPQAATTAIALAYEGSVSTFSGAWHETAGRKIRFVRFQTYDDTVMSLGGAPWFDQCTLRFAKSGYSTSSTTGALRTFSTGVSGECKPLFTGSAILGDMTRNPSGVNRFFGATGSYNADLSEGLGLVGTTMFHTSSNGEGGYIFAWTANFTVHAYGCIIGGPAANNTIGTGDAAIPAGQHDFSGCAYVGIPDPFWCENAAFDTQAEWFANVDTTGIAPTAANVAFVDSAVSAELAAASVLRLRTNRTMPARTAARGVNGRYVRGSNIRGAWQDGTVIRRARAIAAVL